MSGIEVARALYLDKRTVYSYLHDAGVMRPPGLTAARKGPLRDVPHRQIDLTVTLYTAGLSTRQVAEKLGITHSTVRYRLRAAGVSLRSKSQSVKLSKAKPKEASCT